jgi:hypothetical protein
MRKHPEDVAWPIVRASWRRGCDKAFCRGTAPWRQADCGAPRSSCQEAEGRARASLPADANQANRRCGKLSLTLSKQTPLGRRKSDRPARTTATVPSIGCDRRYRSRWFQACRRWRTQFGQTAAVAPRAAVRRRAPPRMRALSQKPAWPGSSRLSQSRAERVRCRRRRVGVRFSGIDPKCRGDDVPGQFVEYGCE